MSVSLLPFVFASAPFISGAFIGWVVFVNGVITHMSCASSFRYCDHLRVFDTAVNVFLCVLVNLRTNWQPQSAILTVFAAVAWVLNSPVPSSEEPGNCLALWASTTLALKAPKERKQARSVLVHVVCVQWVLCVILFAFEMN